MNYYDDLEKRIEETIKDNKFELARSLIEDELKQAYVPKDVLDKLHSYLDKIGPKELNYQVITDDNIVDYLNNDKEKQLLAVNYLNSKNLRNYVEICNEYLNNEEGFINAKVLLVDSLIRQEIGETITFNNNGLEYEFIPKYVLPIEESDGYQSGINYLSDFYLKDPSKLKMAYDLLFKELIMLLPLNEDEDEGIMLAKKIVAYIDEAFARSF